ncbi:uncharacterized protein L201_004131 [Kwoniella dendrophila CBS 6074]|uniref:A1 cistron-splicing factor AAR2 n=1 Tax=Kwoniella dendrophila CBS 6074 TaxID=1295534 RepID=A0AAX4JWK6_9TREE
MNDLTQDQAQALWSAGGFLIFSGLPEGSEFGIDGTYNIIRKSFNGIKFLPPGIHFITWSINQTGTNTGTPPIKNGLIKYFEPKERFLIRYNPDLENIEFLKNEIITDDKLRSIDSELASYQFHNLEQWKSLISKITKDDLHNVINGDTNNNNERILDGLVTVIGEEEDSIEYKKFTDPSSNEEKDSNTNHDSLNFVRFNLKKSWKKGEMIGEEITKYSKDKSWLLGNVIQEQLGGDPIKLISQLQLSFILLLHLSSYSSLLVYKRILSLLCQSSTFLITPNQYLGQTSTSSKSALTITTISKKVQELYKSLTETLVIQIDSIPDGTFDTELPELDSFYLDQIESLRKNLILAIKGTKDIQGWNEAVANDMRKSWKGLKIIASKWGWEINDLITSNSDNAYNGQEDEEESEESEEEGEYAPVIVEL